MDLISRLRDACGLDEMQARAVAGGVLELVGEELLDRFGFEASRSFATEVPELQIWRVDALRFFGRAGRTTHGAESRVRKLLDQVLEEQIPRGEERALVAMLRDLGASARGRIAATLILDFLRARLSLTLLQQVLEASAMMRRAREEREAGGQAPERRPHE